MVMSFHGPGPVLFVLRGTPTEICDLICMWDTELALHYRGGMIGADPELIDGTDVHWWEGSLKHKHGMCQRI